MSRTDSSPGSASGTITAAELGRLIDDAALFASRDGTFPIINAIQFTSTPKNLVAAATDRFVLGASVADYHEAGGREFTVLLALAQAQMVSKIAKTTKAALTDVAITVASEKVHFDFTSGESLAVPKLVTPGDFPDWRKIIDQSGRDTEGSTKVLGFNPAYLAKFSRVSNARNLVVKTTGPTRPILMSIGASFVGCIMPVRVEDSAWKSPDWLAKPEAAAKSPAKAAPKPSTRKRPAKVVA